MFSSAAAPLSFSKEDRKLTATTQKILFPDKGQILSEAGQTCQENFIPAHTRLKQEGRAVDTRSVGLPLDKRLSNYRIFHILSGINYRIYSIVLGRPKEDDYRLTD